MMAPVPPTPLRLARCRPRPRCCVAGRLLRSGGCDDGAGATPADGPGRATRTPAATGYADPSSRTAQAAAQAKADGDADRQRVFTRLAAVPQGIWLTPEQYPAGAVGPFVDRASSTAADEAGQVPTFVVYGIPDRDCTGGFSEGGLPADRVRPVGAGDRRRRRRRRPTSRSVVEPDALASALECDRRERAGRADRRRRRSGSTAAGVDDVRRRRSLATGSSRRSSPTLLEEVGVDDVRGFATNVANYQTDEDERAYGEKLSAPAGRRALHHRQRPQRQRFDRRTGATRGTGLRHRPGRASTDGEHLDAFVWVKPPGESDGECGGGPPPGEFWPERTMELASASGW